METRHTHPNQHPPGQPAAQPFSMQTVLVALRYWWRITAPVGLLFAATAGVIVYFTAKPTFTAAAWLIIKANRESLLDPISRNDSIKFIANQVELMKSPPIIDPVASNPAVASTPEIAREPEPVQALKRLVKVRALSQSDFFVVEFTSTVPQKAALIANEIAKSYFAHQARDATFRSSILIRLLEDQLTAQQAKVEDLRSRWRAMAKLTSGIDPFAAKPTEPGVQLHNPNADLQAQLLKVQLEELTLDVQIKYLESEGASEVPPEPTPWELDQLMQNHPDVARQSAQTQQIERKLADYRDRVANAAANTSVQQLERDLASAREKLAKLQEELRPKIKEDLNRLTAAKRDSDLIRRRQELSANKLMQTVVQEKLAGQISNQKEFRAKSFDEEMLHAEYESAYKLYEAIKAKIDMMRLEQRAPERVEMFKEAPIPERPDVATPYKKILMAAMAAFVLPFGLALGFEALFRRVSSRDQIELTGKIPVVGEVTTLPRRMRHHSKESGIANRELQLFEESIDGLRIYLSLVKSLQGKKVLAVASAISREGKTSLATQLAISIASSSGKPTLLVDGDLRSPDIHRIFGVERCPGVVEVLRGEIPLDDAIDTSFSNHLHLLPAGNSDISPHRILGNGRFEALVGNLRERYEHIIIDTPPILAASEALVMSHTADAAILCVRRDFSRVDQVQEAYSRLECAGVKTAGAVLNGIPARQYAYRYGSYYRGAGGDSFTEND